MNLKAIKELLKHEFAVLLGGSTFIFSIRLMGAALTFLTQLLLVRWMGEDELGRFVFAFSIASVLAFVSTLGLPVAATRFVPQAIAKGRPGLAAGFFRAAAAVVLAAATVCMIVAALVTLVFGAGLPRHEFLTLALSVLLIPFLAALMAQNDIGRSIYLLATTFLPNMLLRHVLLLTGVTALFFAGVQLNAAWIMGVLVASVAVLAVGQFFFVRRAAVKVIGKPEPEYNVREWMRAGLPLVVVFGFTGFFLEINVALAGAFLSPADLAVYNFAFQISNLIAFFLVAVGYQFGPHASRLYGEGQVDALQRLITQTAHLRFFFAVAMFGGLALVGGWLLGLFSPKFQEGYDALLILAGTQVVAGIVGPVAVLQYILGLQRTAIIVSAVAIAFDLVLTPLLATRYGIEGAAVAVLLTMTLWNVLMLVAVIRNTAIEPSVLGLRNLLGRPQQTSAAAVSIPASTAGGPFESGLSEGAASDHGSQKTGTTDG